MRQTGKAKTIIWRWQERFGAEGVAALWRDKTRPSRIPPHCRARGEFDARRAACGRHALDWGGHGSRRARSSRRCRSSDSLMPDHSMRPLPPRFEDEELRRWMALAEERLADLKAALEDMRAQRDAWQAMAQARIRPAHTSAMSRWPWLSSAG
jgi:hypothetical protein